MIKQDNEIKIAVIEERINGLKELFEQHNKLLQLAIDKAEQSMKLKTDSMNEFRAQQADTITTFARNDKLEGYIRSSTERFDMNVKVVNDKIYQLEKQTDNKMEQGLKIISDKFDAVNKTDDLKMENIEAVMNKRFDDLMKDYIRPMFDWKSNMQGRGYVLLLAWPIFIAIVTFILTRIIK